MSATRLNLRQIEVFRAFMLTGSVTGASELLHVSQPAVSRLLSYTETKLGFILFERIKGRLYPTPEARQLFQEVEAVYRAVQRVDQTARDLLEKRSVTLRVCCSPSLSQTLLPEALAPLGERYPDMRIHLDTRDVNEMVEALVTQKFELGVSIQPMRHPNLECRPLYQCPMMVVLPLDHHLADRQVISASDISTERLICYSEETPLGILISSAFRSSGEDFSPAIEVHHTHTACAAVQARAGVAIVDGMSVIGRRWPTLVSRPFDPRTVITVCAVYSRFHPLSMVGRELLTLLADSDLPYSFLSKPIIT